MSRFLVGGENLDHVSTQSGSGIRLPATDFSLDVNLTLAGRNFACVRLNVRFLQSGRSERFLITADGHVLVRRSRVVL